MPQVDLSAHLDELLAALLSPDLFRAGTEDAPDASAVWLRDQYRAIAPAILPDVLRCLGSGCRLAPATREQVRDAARTMATVEVPMELVLRGGIPALRAFGAFVRAREDELSAEECSALLSRAALVAQELGACWGETWAAARADPVGAPSPRHLPDARLTIDDATVELVARDQEGIDDATADMVVLAASGRSNEQIAEATAYSTQAVKWHLSRLMRSWQVTNRSALIAAGFVRGVLTARWSTRRGDDSAA